MKFVNISDLHGEVDFVKNIPLQKDTVLLVPGDIHEVRSITQYKNMVHALLDKFKALVMVPGNHEYYGSNITKVHRVLNEMNDSIENFHFLQDDYRIFEEGDEKVLVLGGTLWTDFDGGNPLTKYDARVKMNDYRYIRHGSSTAYWERKLVPDDTEFFHYKTKDFIKKCVDEQRELCDNLKVLVMTHHAPSFGSVSSQYSGDSLNGCYCSSMDYYIGDINPVVWVHGHVHSPFDYFVGDTRIICNPLGYGNENPNFNPNFSFEV